MLVDKKYINALTGEKATCAYALLDGSKAIMVLEDGSHDFIIFKHHFDEWQLETSLWLVERKADEIDYDEYDAFVVRASTEQVALDIAIQFGGSVFSTFSVKVKPINSQGTTGVILGSFNAG